MKKLMYSSIAASMMLATSAFAQTATSPQPAPAAPAEKMEPAQSPTKATPSVTTTPTPPSTTTAESSTKGTIKLSDEQAKAWVDKVVYSSDNKNLGEVAEIARDSSGNVSELHADIGGFLGIGETRVRVMPSDFKLDNDKVVLNLTADQAKNLPKIAK